jgi:tRNA pseudouridine55 synthase
MNERPPPAGKGSGKPPQEPKPTPTGILIVDKPIGPTSMSVCARVRGALRGAGAPKGIKVGHGGTLDPLATGVLVVLVGKATRLCNKIMVGEKEYLATLDLSRFSVTDDAEGPFEEVSVTTPPTREEVERAAAKFVGTIEQMPPRYSALNIGGMRAYDMARQGMAVPLSARTVEIHEIRVLGYEWPRVELDVRCGKGVYIRSLARDIGTALGTGGMIAALRRTRVGRFTLEGAVGRDDLPRKLTQADLRPIPEDLLQTDPLQLPAADETSAQPE